MDKNFSLNSFRKAAFLSFCSVICVFNLVASEPPQRIHGEINNGERFALSGNVRPTIAYARDQGPVNGSLALPTMTLHFAMSASQKADLQQLLKLQQTRHSTQFHKWLTPEQYAERFGMNSKDLQKVTLWLESQGFTNIQAARGRTFVTFSGTASEAQNAFNTSIHNYITSEGATHYANATEPELPKALNGLVESIHGLHDFHMKPHSVLRPHLTSNLTGNHFLVPNDLATIYDILPLYSAGYNGSGHSIAIVGQTDLIMSDIETFQTNTGQAVKDPTVIEVNPSSPPGTQVSSGDLGESDLDIEWASGIAPGATIVFVTSGDVETSETYAVDNNVADVLSITYGDCESDIGAAAEATLNTMFQQAATQGMTVVAAAGDQGAADCDSSTASVAIKGLAVDVPAALPYVTGVGGTEFNDGTATGGTTYWSATNNTVNGSALSYIPEIGWNDTDDTTPAQLTASGGGASTSFVKPSWQTGTGVPSDGHRDVPDLALTASADQDGYLTCSDGSCVNGLRGPDPVAPQPTCAQQGYTSPCGDFTVSGGTSASTPTFAGIVAILVQQQNGRQGSINPNLYTLASISSNAFHDITTGNNIVPCTGGTPNCSSTIATVAGTLGYSAGVGYDQVTGLGSVNAHNLVDQWNDDFEMSSNPTSVSISPGSSSTATINVSPFGSFTGNIAFTCSVSSGLTATTCSIPGTVSGGTGSATLTITVGSSATTPWWRRIPTVRGPYFLLAAILLSLGICLLTKQRRLQMAGFAFTILLVVGLSSCGGGGSATSTVTTTPSPLTGNVTISGTSGSLVNNITIAVTIPQ